MLKAYTVVTQGSSALGFLANLQDLSFPVHIAPMSRWAWKMLLLAEMLLPMWMDSTAKQTASLPVFDQVIPFVWLPDSSQLVFLPWDVHLCFLLLHVYFL